MITIKKETFYDKKAYRVLTITEGDKLKIENEEIKISLIDYFIFKERVDFTTELEILGNSIVHLDLNEKIPIHIKIEEGSELYITEIPGSRIPKKQLVKSRGDDWFWFFKLKEFSEEEWLIKSIIE